MKSIEIAPSSRRSPSSRIPTIAFAAALTIAGCSRTAGTSGPNELVPWGGAAFMHQRTLMFEACFPDRRIAFDRRTVDYAFLSDPRAKGWSNIHLELIPVAPKQVDWVDVGSMPGQFPFRSVFLEEMTFDGQGGGSDGSQFLALAGSTSTHQPVFGSEQPGENRSGGYQAVALSPPNEHGGSALGVKYWYKVPDLDGADGFTAWTPPVWMGGFSDPPAMDVIRGSRVVDEAHRPAANAPRLRFKDMANADFYSESPRLYQAIYASRLQYAPDRKPESYVAAPVTDEIRPGC